MVDLEEECHVLKEKEHELRMGSTNQEISGVLVLTILLY